MLTLVLLPGLDGTGDLFEPFVAPLSAALGPGVALRVVRYSVDQPLGYDALAAFVAAQLANTRPHVLVGESFSGPLAIRLAAAGAEGLRAVILCCSFASNPRPALAPWAALLEFMPMRWLPSRVLSFFLLGRFATPALRTALAQAVGRVAPRVLRLRLRAVAAVDETAALRRVRVPLLYLQAAHDRLVPARGSALIQQHCPAASVVALPGPHGLLQARPVEAAQAMADFVRATVFSSDRRPHEPPRC